MIIVANRFLSAVLVLSIVGLSFSYQGDKAPQTKKPEAKESVILKMAVQIPTPKEDEVVLVLGSGDFCVLKMGQMATIPIDEKFRTMVGERASFTYVEQGAKSGNNFWRVEGR